MPAPWACLRCGASRGAAAREPAGMMRLRQGVPGPACCAVQAGWGEAQGTAAPVHNHDLAGLTQHLVARPGEPVATSTGAGGGGAAGAAQCPLAGGQASCQGARQPHLGCQRPGKQGHCIQPPEPHRPFFICTRDLQLLGAAPDGAPYVHPGARHGEDRLQQLSSYKFERAWATRSRQPPAQAAGEQRAYGPCLVSLAPPEPASRNWHMQHLWGTVQHPTATQAAAECQWRVRCRRRPSRRSGGGVSGSAPGCALCPQATPALCRRGHGCMLST